MYHPIPARKPVFVLISKKERISQLGDFAVPAKH